QVANTAFRFRQTPVQTVATAGFAHGGDAVRQPQLVDVFGRRSLLAAADMAVHVDEAGQHVVAFQVDLATAFFELRPPLRIDGHAGIADTGDAFDTVAADDDVQRPVGRCAGAVDDGDAAQDQLRIRPLAFAGGAIRCR